MTQTLSKTVSDKTQFFDTEHLHADLKGRSIRGGAATLVGQTTKFAARMVSTVILARLLTPADFGLIAMATTITGFAELFKDLGLSMATVQKDKITHEQVSVLFWINVAVSMLIAVITVALAPGIAWFYGDPRLIAVGVILAIPFVFGGLTVQHQALLRRQMRFGLLAAIPVISMTAGVAAAVVAGALGAGYWALVIMEVSRPAVNAVLVWILCPWRPGLPKRGVGARGMVGFGADLTGFNIVNYFHRNVDNLLIGKYCGSATLGLYTKAYGLLMLPIQQIRAPLTAVAFPVFCRLQGDSARFRSCYIKLAGVIAVASMPLVVFLYVNSREIIRLVLGPQWLESAAIFQILALAAFIQPVSTTRGVAMLTLGRGRRYMWWGVISAAVTVAGFAVGILWGAPGVATGYVIVNYALLLPSLYYCFHRTPLTPKDFWTATWRPIMASGLAAAVMYAVKLSVVGSTPLAVLIVTFSAGLASFVVGLMISPGGRKQCQEYVGYVRLLRARQGTSASSSSLGHGP